MEKEKEKLFKVKLGNKTHYEIISALSILMHTRSLIKIITLETDREIRGIIYDLNTDGLRLVGQDSRWDYTEISKIFIIKN